MHTAKIFFFVLSGCLLFTYSARAEEFIQSAKVYRDYPGYIKPAICENPNLDKTATPSPSTNPMPVIAPKSPAVPVPDVYGVPAETVGTVPVPASNSQMAPPVLTPAAPSDVVTPPATPVVSYEVCKGNDPTGGYLAVWAGFVDTLDADLDGGSDSAEITFEHGYGGGAAAGYDFGPARLEVEASYRRNSADEIEMAGFSAEADGDLRIKALFANAYVDFNTGGTATPYLGAGIGYADVELDDRDDDSVLAGQLAAGVFFPVSRHVAIDIGYRYMVTEDPDLDGVDLEVRQHTGMIGLQFRF